jgi:hypothetical protein
MIDLWQSRRDVFVPVEYWSQIDNEDLVSNSQISYNRLPTGTFMAKEVSSFTDDSQVVGEALMYDENTVNIYTRDKIDDLRVNDIVKYEGKIYRVDNIQKNYVKKQRQFMKREASAEYFISLRG